MQLQYDMLDDFIVVKQLGQGYHSKVKLIKHQQKLYAAKIFKKQTADLNTLLHQLEIISSLEHDNIIKLVSYKKNAVYKYKQGKTQNCITIILEYASGNDLFFLISNYKRFPSEVARTYFHMLIQALEYIHNKGITHRDLKPQNILLDNQFRLKIADFGLSTYLKRGKLHTQLGTRLYQAPEIIKIKQYDGRKVDIFAAGVVLFIMCAGGPPFWNPNQNDQFYKLLINKSQAYWKYYEKFFDNECQTVAFKSLIYGILNINPELRLSISQIKQNEWYKGKILNINELNQKLIQLKQKLVQKQQQKKKIEQQKIQNKNQDKQEKIKQKKTKFISKPFNKQKKLDKRNAQQQIPTFEFNEKYIQVDRTKDTDQFKISEYPSFFLTFLKLYLQNPSQKIIFQQEQATQEYKIITKQQQGKIQISLHYHINYNLEHQFESMDIMEFSDSLNLQILMKWDSMHNLILDFKKISGDTLYYYRLLHKIKFQLDCVKV